MNQIIKNIFAYLGDTFSESELGKSGRQKHLKPSPWYNHVYMLAKRSLLVAIKSKNINEIRSARSLFKNMISQAKKECENNNWEDLLNAVKSRTQNVFGT